MATTLAELLHGGPVTGEEVDRVSDTLIFERDRPGPRFLKFAVLLLLAVPASAFAATDAQRSHAALQTPLAQGAQQRDHVRQPGQAAGEGAPGLGLQGSEDREEEQRGPGGDEDRAARAEAQPAAEAA
jgi:hypothetical protein